MLEKGLTPFNPTPTEVEFLKENSHTVTMLQADYTNLFSKCLVLLNVYKSKEIKPEPQNWSESLDPVPLQLQHETGKLEEHRSSNLLQNLLPNLAIDQGNQNSGLVPSS